MEIARKIDNVHVTFTKQDEETFRQLYRIIKPIDCNKMKMDCYYCPFASICEIIGRVECDEDEDEEAEFITRLHADLMWCAGADMK